MEAPLEPIETHRKPIENPLKSIENRGREKLCEHGKRTIKMEPKREPKSIKKRPEMVSKKRCENRRIKNHTNGDQELKKGAWRARCRTGAGQDPATAERSAGRPGGPRGPIYY